MGCVGGFTSFSTIFHMQDDKEGVLRLSDVYEGALCNEVSG